MSINVTENCIEFQLNEDTATVTFCQQRFITKIRKLAEKFPDECEIVAENKDGSIMAHIPVKWIRISNLSKNLTDEQREEIAERFKNIQDKGRKQSKSALSELGEEL